MARSSSSRRCSSATPSPSAAHITSHHLASRLHITGARSGCAGDRVSRVAHVAASWQQRPERMGRPMRIALISDIHGNLVALDAALRDLAEQRAVSRWMSRRCGRRREPTACLMPTAGVATGAADSGEREPTRRPSVPGLEQRASGCAALRHCRGVAVSWSLPAGAVAARAGAATTCAAAAGAAAAHLLIAVAAIHGLVATRLEGNARFAPAGAARRDEHLAATAVTARTALCGLARRAALRAA